MRKTRVKYMLTYYGLTANTLKSLEPMSKIKPDKGINKTWNELRWKEIENRLSRLQRRIYKASIEGKRNVVHFLQRKLINSFDAKLFAVQQVTSISTYKKAFRVDEVIYDSPEKKINLAKSLKLGNKTNLIHRIYMPSDGAKEKTPLGIPTVEEKAKQYLAKLALEPQWEAIFEAGSYGFRPGRCKQDAVENIFISMRGKPKYVLETNIKECFDRINHVALLEKLNTIPQIKNQIEEWLKAGILVDYANRPKEIIDNLDMAALQGGVISPLLTNIALHGLGTYLEDWYKDSIYVDKKQSKIQKDKDLGYIRYAEDFIVIVPDKETAMEVKLLTGQWLSKIGLELSEEKTLITCTTENFNFLGFSFALVVRHDTYRVKIGITRKSKEKLLEKVRMTLRKNKATSSFMLIEQLTPIIIGWSNYFRYSECSLDFAQLDNVLYHQLRAWVFRRKAQGKNRTFLKEKYFPAGTSYTHEGISHKDNWVLCGQSRTNNGEIINNYLPKLRWVKSKKFVKVKGTSSPFDGNHIYWINRVSTYNCYGPKLKYLLPIQN